MKFYALAGWIKEEPPIPFGGYMKEFQDKQKTISGRLSGKGVLPNFSGNLLEKEFIDLKFQDILQNYRTERMLIKENHWTGENLEFYLFEVEQIPKNLLSI